MDIVVEKELSHQLLGACFAVHHELGMGLLESVYESALVLLSNNSLEDRPFLCQKRNLETGDYRNFITGDDNHNPWK